ncbi:MAG: sulfotransferase [Phycisphaerales bacterium]|nr:sulfotransferase [Phycisphaerales bacterium]
MASYPDFICVGAQKAATTWLYSAIRWVPGVFLPPIKELHYFSELYNEDAKRFGPIHRAEQIEQIRKFQSSKKSRTPYEESLLEQLNHLETDSTSDDWYKGIFDFASNNDVCGEICPCYMSMPTRGVRHVMSINPLMKILVLVRDPVDRAWSHMRMHTKTGALDFDLDTVMAGKVQLGAYMKYTDYASSIRKWKSMTGNGNFRAIVYDRIGEEPQSVVDEILDFVGVDRFKPKKSLTKNVFTGDKIHLPIELRAKLFTDLQPQYDFLHDLFPNHVESWVERHKKAMS